MPPSPPDRIAAFAAGFGLEAVFAPRAGLIVLEALVSVLAAAAFLGTCLLIRVNPMQRLGQISGLAHLGLRFFLFGFVAIAVLAVSLRARGGRGFDLTSRLVCAAIAGLASALVAGGILVALRGTPWGLNGMGGDAGALAKWAAAIHAGESIPPMYPPLGLHVLHLYSDVVGLPAGFAIKHLQILGVAA